MTRRNTTSRALKEVFLAAAQTSDTDECIAWMWAKDPYGYGKCRWDGKDLKPHRIVCEAVHGAAPSTLHEAAHSCHVRACVNPRHLRWATRQENERDKVNAGRVLRGEAVSNSILRPHEVASIYLSTLSQRKLAKTFGISQQLVSNIKLGKRWGHLTRELKYFLPVEVKA